MASNIVTFPQHDVALRANLLAWIDAHPEDSDLKKFTATGVITDGNLPTSNVPIAKVEASNGSGNDVAESAFVTLTVYSSTGTTTDARNIAYRLKAVLPQLTGNGIGSVTDVKGPTKGADISNRRVFVLSCTTTALGTAE